MINASRINVVRDVFVSNMNKLLHRGQRYFLPEVAENRLQKCCFIHVNMHRYGPNFIRWLNLPKRNKFAAEIKNEQCIIYDPLAVEHACHKKP